MCRVLPTGKQPDHLESGQEYRLDDPTRPPLILLPSRLNSGEGFCSGCKRSKRPTKSRHESCLEFLPLSAAVAVAAWFWELRILRSRVDKPATSIFGGLEDSLCSPGPMAFALPPSLTVIQDGSCIIGREMTSFLGFSLGPY